MKSWHASLRGEAMSGPEDEGLDVEVAGPCDERDDVPFALVGVGFGTGDDGLALHPTKARLRKAAVTTSGAPPCLHPPK
jgi:hypothetical protein